MAEVIWTTSALDEINKIAEYIAISNLFAAKKLVKTVFNNVDRLENFPDSGRKPLELNKLNYREIIVNPCRIFYKIEDDNVFILHVMRQERDLRKFLLLN